MRIKYNDLVLKLQAILVNHGVSEVDANNAAKIFAKNSLDGIYSHGVNRFPRFVSYIDKEYVKKDKKPTVEFGFNGFERWNGNLGIGVLNASKAMDRACELADKYGIGIVALNNTNHWMRGGAYGWQAANLGKIGICFTNTMPNMPAWGGVEPKIGNNPFIIAIPKSNKEHVVLDMAMSQFAYGKIEEARMKGQDLPVDGGFDTKGNLTKNPEEIEKSGRVLPTGYWKGSGLSIVLDLVAAVLSNGRSVTDVGKLEDEYGISQVFIAIEPNLNNTKEQIDKIIDNVIKDIKASTPTTKDGKIFYPGEIELKTRKENLELGIPVLEEVWKKIESL
ncbi:2,3-diketo-L-gulonate reductase [Alteracholeplasma palmae J233]|uniref:2,3-diketo-L-gulonate reductase n=1 Tax=Alteracholeplasma palmae (strain ATCC 49389 / J233) TaxID=1318466 RepID=U4KK21_ALTPJ|nr:3-dehydro-L-gulonate 2-dehydrogenase [Alteracholeplasma palmae]CCV63954.1 2,3-diketo-L-gulonate reductase [Alteracholeplasma palmae J233]